MMLTQLFWGASKKGMHNLCFNNARMAQEVQHIS